MTFKLNPALQALSNRGFDANEQYHKRRVEATTARDLEMAAYRNGEAAGFNAAYEIVANELSRLRAKFQNGGLSFEDFNGYSR